MQLVSDDWPIKWSCSHPFVYFRNFWEDTKRHGIQQSSGMNQMLVELARELEEVGLFRFVESPDYDRAAYTSNFLRKKCAPEFTPEIPEAVIHWGLPNIEASPAVDPDRFESESTLRLLYCGQIQPHKGLIRVLRALNQTKSPHRLTVIGDDQNDYANFCRRFVEESGLSERVVFTGKLPPAEVKQRLADDGEIFLLPSLHGGFENFEEPFSIVLLQAMAAGLAVAASPTGGSPEAFIEGESGLFFDANSPESLAALLDRLQSDRKLVRQLGENARSRAHTEFSIQDMVRQIIEFSQQAVDRPAMLYAVRNAAIDPANSGCVRVTRRLAHELEKAAPIRFTTWNAESGELSLLGPDQAEMLSRFNGPVDAQVMAWGGTVQSAPLVRHEIEGSWLALPEIIPAEQFDAILAEAREQKQRTFAIFYDSIALLEPDFCNEEIRQNHAAYMERLAQCDLVIPISHFSGKCLIDFWAERNITASAVATVPLPGEFSGRRLTEESLPSDDEPVRLLCVSTLEPRKNHARLLEAYAGLRERCPDLAVELHLVGNNYAGAIEITEAVQAAASQDSTIHWWRIVDDDTLTRLYTECHFTVYPSMIEGYGLPIVESIWHARPCLCANEGVMSELGQLGGCVTANVRDSADLSAALESLASDPQLRRKLSAEAAQRPLSTWQDYAKDVLRELKKYDATKS
jgi:glycosyltransferase involved in cell wall biosynthesis